MEERRNILLPTRLRRQKMHAFCCVCALLIMVFFMIWKMEWTVAMKIVMSVAYLLCGFICRIYEVAIRKYVDLLFRNVLSSVFLGCIYFGTVSNLENTYQYILIYNVIYIIWLAVAKTWIRHEIAPGWTMLIYDGKESKIKAEAIADSRTDLITDACHLKLSDGDCVLERVKEKVAIYHVTQAVVCVSNGCSEILDYCNKEGISVFLTDKNKNVLGKRYAHRLNRQGLYLVEPKSIYKKGEKIECVHEVTA